MQLKRGWWREIGGGYAILAGEHNGRWYGESSGEVTTSWDSDGISEFNEDGSPGDNLTDHYAGDGPSPVEPVQLCLGWWERRDGGIEEIVEDRNDGTFRWANRHGSRWNDQGQFSRALFDYSDTHSLDLIKRRPDLDQPQTDANDANEIRRLKETIGERDAEIERLKRLVDNREALIEQTHDDLVKALSRLE